DPEFRRIYTFLNRDGYWHVTSPQGLKGIYESGAIKPNVNGRFPVSWHDISQRSYGYIHNCVSLFDFAAATDEQFIQKWDNAHDILVGQSEPIKILLLLNGKQLLSKIIPNSDVWPRTRDGECYGCIPFLECWYPDDIPVDAITKQYCVPRD